MCWELIAAPEKREKFNSLESWNSSEWVLEERRDKLQFVAPFPCASASGCSAEKSKLHRRWQPKIISY